MYLLNAASKKLEYFADERCPPYAILSHSWDEEDKNLLFSDLKGSRTSRREKLRRFPKIRESCRRAGRDGLKYLWVDSCCIDRKSTYEVTAAINSMYSWYSRASICYAYLSDVKGAHYGRDSKRSRTTESGPNGSRSILSSQWFNRGWTLQESYVPRRVSFYDKDWTYLGDKHTWETEISQAVHHPRASERSTRALDELNTSDKRHSVAGHNEPTVHQGVGGTPKALCKPSDLDWNASTLDLRGGAGKVLRNARRPKYGAEDDAKGIRQSVKPMTSSLVPSRSPTNSSPLRDLGHTEHIPSLRGLLREPDAQVLLRTATRIGAYKEIGARSAFHRLLAEGPKFSNTWPVGNG